ncbi:hypothetical protein L596_016430 [Steinernema carpocapsae]|uniref:3'-5' exonuclease domain-containing protein n=1 Tax=Steinernema carpocapsae TaxID=34508 RepID=A0A4U5NIX7_STECR|nr:hypothetical protein L596_016430 [Steinernema carpocapsae]
MGHMHRHHLLAANQMEPEGTEFSEDKRNRGIPEFRCKAYCSRGIAFAGFRPCWEVATFDRLISRIFTCLGGLETSLAVENITVNGLFMVLIIHLTMDSFPKTVKPFKLEEVNLITSKSQLEALVTILNQQTKFALDVEFAGSGDFTCLVQISTEDADYIIDPFALDKDDMSLLKEPFSNPKIFKVVHSPSSDKKALYKDFGLRLAEVVDTKRKMKYLRLDPPSLQHLVKLCCGMDLDKNCKRDNWTVRPLSEANIEYAAKDTHFLLFCAEWLQENIERRKQKWKKREREAVHLVNAKEELESLAGLLNTQTAFTFFQEQKTMRISTKTADFLVDCDFLQAEIKLIRSPFENDKVVKVIFSHGKGRVRYLQKIGLQIRNIFSLEDALTMLNLPCQNWSYLASLHCKVTQLKRNHCVLQLYDHLKKRIAEKDDFLPLNPFVFEEIVMVKTKTELEELVHNLENKVEIAVDLEHEYIDGENDQKSCRMISIVQISTRTKNYVIDALLLKDDLHLLEELFGNEAVQVVHFSGKVSSGQWSSSRIEERC